jgi:hypothetical protein
MKSHKMNKNMVNDVFSNLNTTMCHFFIQDQKFMLAPIILFESSYDDQSLMLNSQDMIEDQ